MSQPSQSRSSVDLTRRQPRQHRQLIVPPIVNTAQQYPETARQRTDGEQARLAGELRLDTGYNFEELIPDLSGRKRIVMFNAEHETRTESEEWDGEAHEKNSLFSSSPTPAPDDPGPVNDFESVQLDAEAMAIAALLDMQHSFLRNFHEKDDISDLPDVMISFHRKENLPF